MIICLVQCLAEVHAVAVEVEISHLCQSVVEHHAPENVTMRTSFIKEVTHLGGGMNDGRYT